MPNWEFEFHSPSHEGDPAIKLDDILKIIKEEVNFEVWLGGVRLFTGSLSDVHKDKITKEVFSGLNVFSIGSRDNKIIFFTFSSLYN